MKSKRKKDAVVETRDLEGIVALLGEFDDLREEMRDVRALLDVAKLSEAFMGRTGVHLVEENIAQMFLLNAICLEYIVVLATERLQKMGAKDEEYAHLSDTFDRLSDTAHVVSILVRERETRTDETEAVAQPQNRIVFVERESGQEVDGFAIDHCNAPGSREAN